VAQVSEILEDGGERVLDVPHDVQFFVEEGPYFYPLACTTAGWGSLLADVSSARVLMVTANGLTGNVHVLGEAELRTDRLRPRYNANTFVSAKSALEEQNALRRVAPAVRALPIIRVPRPNLGDRIGQIGALVVSKLAKLSQPTRVEWTIGIMPPWDITLGGDLPWPKVAWLTPPENGIIADPFLVEEGQKLWLFYERMLTNQPLGTLWAAPVEGQTVCLEKEMKALETAYHLSFPNVFSDQGQWYMLPEQARSGSTSLYRAEKFPDKWTKSKDILPGFPGIDPVLYRRDGVWWLFVTHGARPCNENNLFLFHAASLDDEFVSHPMNPIKTGLHGARMAGRLVDRGDGKIFRLGQDGRKEYGHSLAMFEITELTKDSYRESHINTWAPEHEGKYSTGFHSYAESTDMVIIDGKRLVRRGRRSFGEAVNRALQRSHPS
jgi:hypothetical protein